MKRIESIATSPKADGLQLNLIQSHQLADENNSKLSVTKLKSTKSMIKDKGLLSSKNAQNKDSGRNQSVKLGQSNSDASVQDYSETGFRIDQKEQR